VIPILALALDPILTMYYPFHSITPTMPVAIRYKGKKASLEIFFAPGELESYCCVSKYPIYNLMGREEGTYQAQYTYYI
jgi:hypothetical protein